MGRVAFDGYLPREMLGVSVPVRCRNSQITAGLVGGVRRTDVLVHTVAVIRL